MNKELLNFKKGDVVHFIGCFGYFPVTLIFKEYSGKQTESNNYFSDYCHIKIVDNDVHLHLGLRMYGVDKSLLRKATEDEKNLLLNKMKKVGKTFDFDKMKIVDFKK
jgi:hypothetical protein